MNEDQHERLRKFLEIEFARTEGNQCVRVDLVVPIGGGYRGPSLRTWVRKESPDLFERESGVEDLVNEARQFVNEQVETHAASTRFVVTTTQHLGRTQHHQFRVHYDDGDEGSHRQREELPDASGLVSQLMRHSDNQAKMLLQIVTLTSHTNQRLIEELGTDNARLRRERGDMYAQVEDAQNHRLERELAAATAAAQEQRKDLAMTKLMEILPIISQKLMTNGESTTASASQHDAISVAVNDLADIMSSDIVNEILPRFNQQQQMAFFKVFQLARAAKEAAAKEGTGGSASASASTSPPP